MKKVLSLTAISLVAASSIYAADSVESAFSKGKTTGEFSLYSTSASNGGTTKDSGFTVGSVYLNYTTDTFAGFKASLGMRANHLMSEKEEDNYDQSVKSVVTEANLAYSNDKITVIAGRQPIDLEWIGDYHNAVVGIATIDKLTVVAGYTNAKGVADADDSLTEVDTFNKGNSGAKVVDVTYAINDSTKVNAYYMDAKQIFSAVGGKVEASFAGVSGTLKYAKTSEDKDNTPNGSIMALDLGYEVSGVKLQAGYIKTGKDNGIGSLGALGDNINPLDSGNRVYDLDASDGVDTDAKTFYLGASTSVAGFDIGALYGSTDYKNSGASETETEKELNLTASKELAKNLKASALYGMINAETSDNDSNYLSLQLTYSF